MKGSPWVVVLCWTAGLGGCAGPEDPVALSTSPIVHGTDDRREYFQLTSELVRTRMSGSVVALVSRQFVRQTPAGPRIEAPNWSETSALCPQEPFADQPAAAFCSGVLVDRDLVLTSAHCLRLYSLEDVLVVFGYYQLAPGRLAVGRGDIFTVREVVSESLGETSEGPRVDHAFVRLAGNVDPGRTPAPIGASVVAGQPVTALGAGGGVPFKADAGGSITDVGMPWFDHFWANTDTFKGFSGGGVFDADLRLLGILVRGDPDLEVSPQGCNVARHAHDASSREEFTYAAAAVERLCAQRPEASALCAGPELEQAGGGCSLVGNPRGGRPIGLLVLALLGLTVRGWASTRRSRYCHAQAKGPSRRS